MSKRHRENMHEKLNRITRRFWLVLYVILAFVGVSMVVLACTIWSATAFHDIGISLGGGILATVLVTVFVMLLLPDDSDRYEELKEWGIVKMHEQRKEVAIKKEDFPHNNLDFVAFGLSHFRQEHGDKDPFLRRIEKGLHVRILTMHPESKHVREQREFENEGDIRGDILKLIKWVEEIEASLDAYEDVKGSIELKLYDGLPLHFYCRADYNIWVGPYLPGMVSNNVITYEFWLDSKGGERLQRDFEKYWNGERGIRIVAKDSLFFSGDQRASIESVLKFFCDEVRGKSGYGVIGVVALFRKGQGLRRTLFSCNKGHEEKHHCHRIEEGAVGKMVELNEGAGTKKVLFFRDYQHDLSITYCNSGRGVVAEKIDFMLKKMSYGESTNAILSAPLYFEDEMIGAVTFDINTFSDEYKAQVADLKKLPCGEKLSESAFVCKWFYQAEQCAGILSHMLGADVNCDFAKLYEEEWTYP